MAVPPPQYPEYPYPPPLFPYGPSSPPRMPGLTTTAVVLLWVMVALNALGALLTIPMFAFGPGTFTSLFGPEAVQLAIVAAAQGLAWAIVRAVLAVKIARRSAWARKAAFVVEGTGMAFQLTFAVLIFNATMADLPENGSYSLNFDCTGIVLPVLVIYFLSSTRSLQWCDR
ncbi:hypothetical protein [Glycomyces rhizosphaerae]|uniref:Uncharacterized protein n=1 Tax=Glycomyces rhizosphaerae TaxID=2054422 RepID=A0ABV7PXD9_9ACTN